MYQLVASVDQVLALVSWEESKLRGIIVSCINGNSDREDLCVLNGELAEWVEDE